MTITGTLWGDLRQRQTKVILSVAALNELELHLAPFSFFNRPAEFTEKFPYSKIPAFEATDGFKLIEGAPIARYLSGSGTKVVLLGSNPKEVALVDQWVHFAEDEIATPLVGFSALIYGYYGDTFNREALDKYTQRLLRALKYLESHLATRSTTFVASNTLTLADLVVASAINLASRLALGINERKQYPASFALYEKVTGDKRIQEYWGTEGFVDAPLAEPIKWTGD